MNVYGAVIVARATARVHPIYMMNIERCQVAANPQPGLTTQAASPPVGWLGASQPVGCQKPHPPSSFIIITQPKNWYSFYHPTEGRRLSRPRHCSRMCSPCPRLYIVVAFMINMQLPMVGCEPWSSHTTVRHVTTRLRCCLTWSYSGLGRVAKGERLAVAAAGFLQIRCYSCRQTNSIKALKQLLSLLLLW